jgi:hypothetical protein
VNKQAKQRAAIVVAVVSVLGALLGVSYAFGELWFRTTVFGLAKLGTPFWVLFFWGIVAPLLIGILMILIGRDALDDMSYPRRRGETISETGPKNFIRIGIALVVTAVVLCVPGTPKTPGLLLSAALRNGHDTQAEIAENIKVSNDPHPEYLRRANSVQAERLVDELSNDPSISSTSPVQYSVADGQPAWCAGAYGRKDAVGRRSTVAVVCVTDDKNVVRASWQDTNVPSLGGNFSTNLAKKVAEMHPGKSLDEHDLRFGIKDGKPFLVAPLTQISGGMHPRTLPGGVLYIDGAGTLTYDAHAQRGEYGVAVVPYKVAEDLRGSLNHRSGYWCAASWNINKKRCLEQNTPYQDTGSVQGDVNSENFSEFVLNRADGGIAMVTPLTYYGKARNISAYLDVTVDEVKAGVMPTATLYEGANEVSYKTLVQTLTPAYTADLTWLTEIDGSADTATASRIFEITPSKPGKMVLTIGTATNPQYIVEVDAGLTGETLDFSWCVYSDTEKKGGEPRKIECRSRAEGEAAIGTLRGLNIGNQPEESTNTGKPVDSTFDLTKLTVDELKALINEAADELANR